MATDREIVVVPFGGGGLPRRSPTRRSWWDGAHLNWPPAADCRENISAAKKSEAGMIEIVALEIVDCGRVHARADKWIDLVLHKQLNARHHLQAEILSDHASSRDRVVR